VVVEHWVPPQQCLKRAHLVRGSNVNIATQLVAVKVMTMVTDNNSFNAYSNWIKKIN